MRLPLPAGARRRGLIAALLACMSIASATQAADAVDPAQLAEARAAYQAAFEHYTRLVTTPGAKGDRAAALAAYREASTRYRALQARLEGAGRSAPGTPAPAAPTAGSRQALRTEGIAGIVSIDTDPTDPRARLEQDASAGAPRAQALLGLLALRGLGAQADPEAGIAWLRRAAAAGDADAMAMLADELDSGLWVEPDPARARSLRERAARLGSPLATWGR